VTSIELSGHAISVVWTLAVVPGSSNVIESTFSNESHSVTHHANRVVLDAMSTIIVSLSVSSFVILAWATICLVVLPPLASYLSTVQTFPFESVMVGAPSEYLTATI